MKNILPFSIFESDDEEDYKPKGFKFSESDIRDRIYYLTDIGFSIDDDKIDSYYMDNDGNKQSLIKAEKAVYFLKLTKKLESKLKYRSVNTGWSGSKSYYYLNNSQELLEIAEEIASFSAHFDEVYHNLTYNSDTIEVSFYIYSNIEDDVKRSEKESIIEYKAKSKIVDAIYNFRKKFIDTKLGLTKKFKDEARENKLGESTTGFYGGNEFLIMPFNIEGLTKSVINNNFRRIEKILSSSHWDIPSKFHEIEFRIITEDDINKLNTQIKNATEDKLKERYLGLYGVILTLKYKDWYENIKKDWEENFEEYTSRRGYYY